MAPWYRAMDLLLHTAWREGHPKVFNEAMVFSLPIVSSRIAGSRDVVDDGVTGMLCEPGDVEAFAAATSRLIGSVPMRRTLGSAGRLRVERSFSAAASLDRLADLYRDVAARS
jgi:glycosyltransferase involved in cell wall biosynthesis